MNLFEKYGRFCSHYSLEVMVCFLTMFVGTVSLNLRSPTDFCRWSFECSSGDEKELPTHASSDAVLLSILRCATIVYFFVKLRKISKLGSGYLVAGVCVCVAFAAITFAATLVQLLQKDWTIVGAALPIFLLLIDLSRIVILIQHSLTANSFSAVCDRIAEAMKKIGPAVTLDTIIETLVIIASSTLRVRQLQEIFCFACLSVFLNYIIFTTFVPACLSILLMITSKKSTMNRPEWYNENFSNALQKEISPLTYRMKFLLCCTLLLLNGLRMLYGDNFPNNEELQSKFDSVLTLTPQQFFSVTIIMLLFSKFFMEEDKSDEQKESSQNSGVYASKIKTSRKGSFEDIQQKSDRFNSPRPPDVCMELLKEDSNLLTDGEIISLVRLRKIQEHRLELVLKDPNRGVHVRRLLLDEKLMTEEQQAALTQVPFAHYNFSKATTACCENTVGYIPVPVGVVGPLLVNGKNYFVPMATTEGTLLASTNRGMKAVYMSGGAEVSVYADGMTRAPVVEFPSAREACEMASWLQDRFNFELVKDKFDETSRYARLESILPIPSGRLVFIRFRATTGDAMGMNMVSKGAEHALKWLQEFHPTMKVVSLSGNVCTDKKPSSVNWILGRGKSVIAEARIPASVIKSVLKTNIDSLAHLNTCKNHIGSGMAGSIGGFNAHAANAVTAIYIATGQDPAQNVEGSNCMTILEKLDSPEISEPMLLMTCTMPCIEVATCGGGTALDAQRACLNLMGVGGSSNGLENAKAGQNARQLAQIVCATVLASELSLLSALSAGHLVQSHMKHNRLPREQSTTKQSEHSVLFNL